MDFFTKVSNKYVCLGCGHPVASGMIGVILAGFIYEFWGKTSSGVENLLLYQIRVQSTWPLRIEINYIIIVLRSYKR